jgi:thiamine biosynthesis lipoprotein
MASPLQLPDKTAVLSSSTTTGHLQKLAFPALGTTCEVQYVAPGGKPQADAFERAAVSWVSAFEAKYSRFIPTSLVSRINAAAGYSWITVDEETDRLFELCETFFAMTQGVLDPTALPLIRLWNWKAPNPVIPSASEIEAACKLVGWTKVRRSKGRIFLPTPGMALDFGGFGKEYAVDIVAQIALDHGITNALVDFGHDLRVLGSPPGCSAWHIGLEDPQRPGLSSESIAIAGSKGVASSGDYIRSFKVGTRRYGHIVDPRTGWPVMNGCHQATIIAGTCLQAGVLSTTAFVLGIPDGLKFIQSYPSAEGLLITDNSRAQTRGFYRHVTH